jgi:rhodanese-related sulfurtransferase
MPWTPELTVEALAAQLEGPPETHPVLVDVRRPDEHAWVALPNSVLIPLPELEERVDELEAFRGRPIVVYCHHGIRSRKGADVLIAAGFDAKSLKGGIHDWARVIDTSMRRY